MRDEQKPSAGKTPPGPKQVPELVPKPAPATKRPHSSCTPYNPGLHNLVAGKQAWSEPLDQEAEADGFVGWHQRGYLPHRDLPGLVQFLTIRLNDSFPANRRGEWEALLKIENNHRRRVELERYLDLGRGACWLRQREIADLTETSLRHFDRERYELLAWCIMPNHVHILMQLRRIPLKQLMRDWKGFVARNANRLFHRGGTFWECDYWDTYVRNEEQLVRFVRYTESNPVKAGFVSEAKAWSWSSARFRDEYGHLIR